MAKRKLDVPVPAGEGCSMDIRPIDNGFIVRESSYGPKGYKQSERYSPTKPKVSVEDTPKARKTAPSSTLAKAIKSMGGK